ncbi:MAG TPA: helix-turn-helix domain-containing protein [Xanthobacteraceae bacterium]|nr:helix-turn-helix domain-containing protein [Xanthobacteraceae bacterium]
MTAIPTYALYGEQGYDSSPDWLHWETLLSRSRLYGFRIAPHRHEQFFQILHLTGGKAQVTMDNTLTALGPPAVIAIPALPVHGYIFSEDVEGVVVTLFERDVREALVPAPEVDVCLRRPHILQGPSDEIAQVGREIGALIAEADVRAPGRAIAMRARIGSTLAAIYRAVLATSEPAPDNGGRAQRHVQAFQQLVEREYRQHRPISFYASALGITPPHLNRICQSVLGASALKVIERRLLLEAKRYLTFSSLSIKEIAALLGYTDAGYFNRVFRRETGVAPGQFRERR